MQGCALAETGVCYRPLTGKKNLKIYNVDFWQAGRWACLGVGGVLGETWHRFCRRCRDFLHRRLKPSYLHRTPIRLTAANDNALASPNSWFSFSVETT